MLCNLVAESDKLLKQICLRLLILILGLNAVAFQAGLLQSWGPEFSSFRDKYGASFF